MPPSTPLGPHLGSPWHDGLQKLREQGQPGAAGEGMRRVGMRALEEPRQAPGHWDCLGRLGAALAIEPLSGKGR